MPASLTDHALHLGADFAELFVEHHQSSQIELLSGEIDKINSGIDFGIGIRLVFGHKVLYGYTNSTERDELLRVTSLLAAREQRDPQSRAAAFNLSPVAERHPARQPLSACHAAVYGTLVPAPSDKVAVKDDETLAWCTLTTN